MEQITTYKYQCMGNDYLVYDPNRSPVVLSAAGIARLCDRYSIPFASNVATAEVLIQGLRRGDLDWRNIVNPHNHK